MFFSFILEISSRNVASKRENSDLTSEKRFITGDNNNPKTRYHLCSIGTLDSRILYLLKRKKQLSKEMIDRAETTPDELKHLIIGTENEESK